MKVSSILVAVLFVLILNGCNNAQPKPTYNKDYSKQKILIRQIIVKEKYQAKDIISQLNSSFNKLDKFINLQQSKSIVINNEPEKRIIYTWTDSSNIIPQFGNKIFELKDNSYLQEPLNSSIGWIIVYLEKRISKQEFSQLQAREQEKQRQLQAEKEKLDLDRIASYEINYMNEYKIILNKEPSMKTTYIQPINKKEPCKIWFGYNENNKWFKEDSYKMFWDGRCKNGYADGLGREIEKDDLMDKWGIAIYKKGIPTYYVINDVLRNTIFEGIDNQNEDISYGVRTIIKNKINDIDIFTITEVENKKEEITLFTRTSPFWDGVYQYYKIYPNFSYTYNSYQNTDSSKIDFEFFISDSKMKNGWAIAKPKKQGLITGEFKEDKFFKLNLPKIYNDKADIITKEMYKAQQQAFSAQEQAQLVKKQYKKTICKDKVTVNFMDNDDYKEICNSKSDQEIFAKINEKMKKITDAKNAKLKQESEARIAKLEQERYAAQQQKQERQRQESLSLERQRLAEIQRANRATERARSSAQLQQGIKNLTDQINNMTPKTYNVNMYHY